MSWAEVALSKAALKAGELKNPALREGAIRGLEALSEPKVTEALERRGETALLNLATSLVGDDLTGARLAFTSDKPGMAGVLEELDAANAEDTAALLAEQQAREDWEAVMGAIGSVGVMAIKLALTLAMAGL